MVAPAPPAKRRDSFGKTACSRHLAAANNSIAQRKGISGALQIIKIPTQRVHATLLSICFHLARNDI